MGEIGLVTKNIDDMIEVSLERSEACTKCKACIAGFEENQMLIIAKNLCDAKVGDKVNIELSEKSFIKATLIMYGFPLVALTLGIYLGLTITNLLNIPYGEVISFALGVILMVGSYKYIADKEDKQKFKADEYTPMANYKV